MRFGLPLRGRGLLLIVVDTQLAHQPLHRAPGHHHALAAQLLPDLPGAVDLEVGVVHRQDFGLQLRVAYRPAAGGEGVQPASTAQLHNGQARIGCGPWTAVCQRRAPPSPHRGALARNPGMPMPTEAAKACRSRSGGCDS